VRPDALAEAVAQSIAGATGERFQALSTEEVGGGCIHHAFRLEGRAGAESRRYFVKANEASAAPMFEAEADGLQALRATGTVRVPGVVTRGVDGDDDRAWLVLEWLELAPLNAGSAARLGEALAALHRVAQAHFGWARDNFIGASPQPNGWSDDWLAFWRSNRLMAQLRIAATKRLPSRMIDRGERLAADCEAFFSGHAPERSLLHGDLWGGNASALADGTPVVFDPAVYVGDREADVAMTELFGGFPPDFHSAYRAAWPLADGYRIRRDLYNTYHVLNHANLFAGSYVRQAEQAIERLLGELG
jgi:protein-ribulosamine 3-kinase